MFRRSGLACSMVTITLTDEQGIGHTVLEKTLELDSDTLTLRELLRLRVYEEAANFNAAHTKNFSGLVQPEGGPKREPKRRVEWQTQFKKAVQAFERRAFIVLVDNEQVGSLETVLTVRARTRVTFLKLVPLVGG